MANGKDWDDAIDWMTRAYARNSQMFQLSSTRPWEELVKEKDEAIEQLRAGLDRLTGSCEAYMRYHLEKFYDGDEERLGPGSGLNPAIREARALLAKHAKDKQ